MKDIKIGISIGDVNGVGLEVILKTLSDERILNYCTPVIYGASKVVSYHKNIADVELLNFQNIRNAADIKTGTINVLNCWNENVNIKLGQVNEVGGKYAIRSLERATADLKAGKIDGIVTAPIHKEAMQMANFEFPGHTEYLTAAFEIKTSLMLMVNDSLRIGLVTNHIPVSKVPQSVSRKLVARKIQIMHDTLRIDFGIDQPKIAVLALNPHAGDGGLIGNEEEGVIIPAIEAAKKQGALAIGPYSADGFFGSGEYSKFDGILAMYHDQGLIPFKALSFGSGVNYTAGLPFVRTSPDHGTAMNIAGTSQADPSSFRKALFVALDVIKNRMQYLERNANPLKGKAKDIILHQEDEDISKLPEK